MVPNTGTLAMCDGKVITKQWFDRGAFIFGMLLCSNGFLILFLPQGTSHPLNGPASY
jgi:hypothetical protein